MKKTSLFYALLISLKAFAAPHFVPAQPFDSGHYEINAPALWGRVWLKIFGCF
ncbi:MAG: hypothetical protein H0U57_07095 [Tatlockia sp.]|nr:hypothetical protein [Tatlockia sp.]